MKQHNTPEVSQTAGDFGTHAELIADLKNRSKSQIKSLFWSLPVPDMDEIQGEYEGILLNQGGWLTAAMTRFFVNKEGAWLGKAFQPVSEKQGRGYNLFRTRRGVRRSLRMQTHLRDSDTPEGYKLMIEYGEMNDGVIGRITDELRRLAPGLYLGIGNVPLGGGLFPRLRRKVMFAMAGPVAEFREEAADKDIVSDNERFTGVAA